MNWGSLLLNIGLSLIITMISYLLVPTILAIKQKQYNKKKIKKILITNCILVWIAFRVVEIAFGNDPSSGAAVILWGTIGYGILKKYCLNETSYSATSASSPTAQTLQSNVQPVLTPTPVARQKIKYCSRCSKPIDAETKKCVGCGKQYFGGTNLKKVLTGVLCVFWVVSIVGNILLYIDNTQLIETNQNLTKANATLAAENKEHEKKAQESDLLLQIYKEQLDKYESELSFFNSQVVFIENNNSKIYHRYSCTNFDKSDFKALDWVTAVLRGYHECPNCN